MNYTTKSAKCQEKSFVKFRQNNMNTNSFDSYLSKEFVILEKYFLDFNRKINKNCLEFIPKFKANFLSKSQTNCIYIIF